MRLFPLLLCICLGTGAVAQASDASERPAESGPKPLASAYAAIQAQDWAAAMSLAERAGGAVAVDLVTWERLRAGQGTGAEALAFLDRRADWPGLKLLRKRMESQLSGLSAAQVIRFFGGQAPQTGKGLLAYVAALQATGKAAKTEAALVAGWREIALKSDEHAALVAAHENVLKPHYTARLDMALWKGWKQNTSDMLPLVGNDWQALAAARAALRNNGKGVDALIAAVPAALADHPGLAYERFRWRLGKKRRAEAIDLMLKRSPDQLGEAAQWGRARRDLARRLMRAGDVQKAYELASTHGLTTGRHFADLEWLSGFLALRFLDRPDLAQAHFKRFRADVYTPISLGRAGYWMGRAEEALGNKEAAQAAYAFGAEYQTSFYGLLAAEKAGVPFDAALKGAQKHPGWKQAGFAGSSVFQAALLLINAGQEDLAERFLRHLTETLPEAEIHQLGDLLLDLGQQHIAVMVGKQAAQRGLTIARPYYPLHPLTGMKLAVQPEMSLAIARRESEFNPTVVSHAGAEGLMQVMPATARLVAGRLGVDHDASEVLNNWRYNAILGAAYLAQLGAEFEGNVILVSAGYNAGPRRPIAWMQDRGDPRKRKVDVVDWIEMIPFNETRNYVMRVAESLPVYRARLGKDPLPQPFSQELKGSSVLPLSP